MNSTMPMNSTMSGNGNDMSGMGMDMGMGSGSCKISMLWNWYTIDSCFLAESWHVKSKGAFAASCIGVIALTMTLEFLRRACREYDLFILKQWQSHVQQLKQINAISSNSSSSSCCNTPGNAQDKISSMESGKRQSNNEIFNSLPSSKPSTIKMKVSPIQQIIRAILHAVTFGVAYIIMLLAMYFNGFIIISIIIGAGLGKFFGDWMQQEFVINKINSNLLENDRLNSSEVQETTVCCG